MNRKTLGGERLGSGNKMQVELHGFERSTHDLSYIWRSTMSAGTLVPFMCEVALPGDTFDIRLNCQTRTHPTIGPLFGSFKVQLDVFNVPIRIYHAALHQNKIGIGLNMAQIKLPKITLYGAPIISLPSGRIVADPDNAQINPSCIMSYLGIRGIGTITQDDTTGGSLGPRSFNAIPILAYWDIFKNYYSNKQEENAWVIHKTISGSGTLKTILTAVVGATNIPLAPNEGQVALNTASAIMTMTWSGGTPPDWDTVVITNAETGERVPLTSFFRTITNGAGTTSFTDRYIAYGTSPWYIRNYDYATVDELTNLPPELVSFPLANIDTMKDMILAEPMAAEFSVNASDLDPYQFLFENAAGTNGVVTSIQQNQEGLAVKTYQSDLFNNWLSTEWIDGVGGINEITAIDTSGGSINVDTIILARKVYDMLNRIAVSGGTYYDWLDAVYDHNAFRRAETPVYCGGLIKELVFQEVVSNAAAEGDQPLGTLAGKGVMSSKHKGGEVIIRVDEPSYIIGIVSLTPRVDYSQGNKWHVHLETLDDLHKPSLDQIGFQELIQEQMAFWTTNQRVVPGITYETQSAGKQPSWINYMTNVNEVRGNFAVRNNEMFMTLNRRYEAEWDGTDTMRIKDLTTYIDPTLFNHIFAETSLDAQNFWTQISVDMIARRKMSAKVMPNL